MHIDTTTARTYAFGGDVDACCVAGKAPTPGLLLRRGDLPRPTQQGADAAVAMGGSSAVWLCDV